MSTRFTIVHLELAEANSLVAELHRHHKPVQGHRFSLGAMENSTGKLVGAAIVGRPVSREIDSRRVVEITRLVSDGTEHVCSFLYGACARAASALGYKKIQTYILEEEPGTSLKAAGFAFEALTSGGDWNHSRTNAGKRRTDQPMTRKQRWCLVLR